MKRIVINVLCGIIGIILGVVITQFSVNDCSFKLSEILSLVVTSLVSIIVVFIAKTHSNNDVARQFIIDDLNRLCDCYRKIGNIIDDLHEKSQSIEIVNTNDEAKKRIQLLFGNGDLLIDQINEEIEVVYKRSQDRYLRDASEEYHKFITDGDLWAQSDFKVSLGFIKDNNEKLNSTIAKIKKKAIEIIQDS